MVSSLLPVLGPSFDAGLIAVVARQQEERLWVLCDELLRLDILLTESLKDERFIHNVAGVVDAARRTWRHEKVRLFARLLHSSTQDWGKNQNRFEEYFELVQSMSWREIHVLLILHELELKYADLTMGTTFGQVNMPGDRRTRYFWTEFMERTEKECEVSKEEFSGFMNRLNRTGLFKTGNGAVLGGDMDYGKITPIFGEFCKWLQVQAPDSPEQSAQQDRGEDQ